MNCVEMQFPYKVDNTIIHLQEYVNAYTANSQGTNVELPVVAEKNII